MGRTTLALDEDVVIAARQLAATRHISLGEAASELMRRGAATVLPDDTSLTGRFSIIPRGAGPRITSEDVYRLMEDEGL